MKSDDSEFALLISVCLARSLSKFLVCLMYCHADEEDLYSPLMPLEKFQPNGIGIGYGDESCSMFMFALSFVHSSENISNI